MTFVLANQTLHRNGCKGHWQRSHFLAPLGGVDQPFPWAHFAGPLPVPALVTAMQPHIWHFNRQYQELVPSTSYHVVYWKFGGKGPEYFSKPPFIAMRMIPASPYRVGVDWKNIDGVSCQHQCLRGLLPSAQCSHPIYVRSHGCSHIAVANSGPVDANHYDDASHK